MIPIKIERILARLRMILQNYLKTSGQVYVEDRISEYQNMWRNVARLEGAEFINLATDLWEITLNGKRTRIKNDILEFDNPVTLDIAGRKPLIYQLMRQSGLCVPDYHVFRYDDLEVANRFLENNPAGCVVKPANGTSSGQGVTTHILSRPELRKAAILASLYCKELVIEAMIPGECYRLLVLDSEVIHAVCRRGYRLKADGSSNVAELIKKENVKSAKTGAPKLDIDRDCHFNLNHQGLTLESVPPANQEFLIKSVNDRNRKQIEVRTVYNTVVTEQIGGALKQNAIEAARILGSRFVGVDFISVDGTRPLEENGGVINEVNTTPGLHHHYDISAEQYPEPAIKILKALLA